MPHRLRFAPSPNGFLHLGHAYSVLFCAKTADRLGGTMLLRLEDIDPLRCKPEFDAMLLFDLGWLGLAWPEPVWRQSERMGIYQEAADRLREGGLLYPCFCSRKEVAGLSLGVDPDGAPLYPGTCRAIGETERGERLALGALHHWRLDMAAATVQAGALLIEDFAPDGTPKPQRRADPARWGDAVIVRKDTPTSYHLSVVVDDAAQAITHVTRGEDLYEATHLHRLLQALLGFPAPAYCHHALLRDEGSMKLAKSRGSKSLKDLRDEGWTPRDVRHRLGFGEPPVAKSTPAP